MSSLLFSLAPMAEPDGEIYSNVRLSRSAFVNDDDDDDDVQ